MQAQPKGSFYFWHKERLWRVEKGRSGSQAEETVHVEAQSVHLGCSWTLRDSQGQREGWRGTASSGPDRAAVKNVQQNTMILTMP